MSFDDDNFKEIRNVVMITNIIMNQTSNKYGTASRAEYSSQKIGEVVGFIPTQNVLYPMDGYFFDRHQLVFHQTRIGELLVAFAS